MLHEDHVGGAKHDLVWQTYSVVASSTGGTAASEARGDVTDVQGQHILQACGGAGRSSFAALAVAFLQRAHVFLELAEGCDGCVMIVCDEDDLVAVGRRIGLVELGDLLAIEAN